jgi:hypothetical protein
VEEFVLTEENAEFGLEVCIAAAHLRSENTTKHSEQQLQLANQVWVAKTGGA